MALNSFEKLLQQLQITNKETLEEAMCISKILELNKCLDRLMDKKRFFLNLAERCDLIIKHLGIDRNLKWCKDFAQIYQELQSMQTPVEDYIRLFRRVRASNPEIFDELDNQFNKYRGKIEFINYILDNHPYKGYDQDKKKRDFKTYNNELLTFLMNKYQPTPYARTNEGTEVNESEKKHCLYNEISSKISNLLTKIQ